MKIRRTRGLSLVELVVVLMIIGILISLLLPGIQAARESSRRVECQNNLRQLGVALSNFAARHKQFPMGENQTLFSAQAQLMNDVDARIADRVDLTVMPGVGINQGISRLAAPSTFRCPSDPFADEMSCSYAICIGTCAVMLTPEAIAETQMILPSSRISETLGAFEAKRAVGLNEFQDGLSHMVLMSDVMVGSQRDTKLGPGRPYNSLAHLTDMEIHDPAASNYFAHLCAAVTNPHPEWIIWISRLWYDCNMNNYNHILPPNHSIPDCARNVHQLYGVRSARSYHRGGVQSVWGDGHVSFESKDIELNVWRRIATRNGQEKVDDE